MNLKIQGLYALYNEDKELIYIGKSNNIGRRLKFHNKAFTYCRFLPIDNSSNLGLMELLYIDKYKPIENSLDKNISVCDLNVDVEINLNLFTKLTRYKTKTLKEREMFYILKIDALRAK